MADFALIEQLDQAITAMLSGAAQLEPAEPTLAALMDIAGKLRDLPDDRFMARLDGELGAESERRIPMSASTVARSAVIHAVTPFITVPDGEKLVEFLKHAFGAEETTRRPHGPGDGFVAVLKIGDSDLLIMSEESARGQERPAALHVYVKDCDAAYQRALEGGALVVGLPGQGFEPADRPWGERAAFMTDSYGNHWNIATRFGSSYVPEDGKHVRPGLLPRNASALIDFLERAFGAEEVGPRHEVGGRVEHAFIRIGEVLIEMADALEEGLRPFGYYMSTDDVDSVYRRAVAAGAVSIAPPADQSFGDRIAVIQDPFGNQWVAAKHIKGAEA
jgi:PhnB protein